MRSRKTAEWLYPPSTVSHRSPPFSHSPPSAIILCRLCTGSHTRTHARTHTCHTKLDFWHISFWTFFPASHRDFFALVLHFWICSVGILFSCFLGFGRRILHSIHFPPIPHSPLPCLSDLLSSLSLPFTLSISLTHHNL